MVDLLVRRPAPYLRRAPTFFISAETEVAFVALDRITHKRRFWGVATPAPKGSILSASHRNYLRSGLMPKLGADERMLSDT